MDRRPLRCLAGGQGLAVVVRQEVIDQLIALWNGATGAEKLLVVAILIILGLLIYIRWLFRPPR